MTLGTETQMEFLENPLVISLLVVSCLQLLFTGLTIEPPPRGEGNPAFAYLVGLFSQIVLVPAVWYGIAYGWNISAAALEGTIVFAVIPGSCFIPFYSFLLVGSKKVALTLFVVSCILSFAITPLGFWIFTHSDPAMALDDFSMDTLLKYFPMVILGIFAGASVILPPVGYLLSKYLGDSANKVGGGLMLIFWIAHVTLLGIFWNEEYTIQTSNLFGDPVVLGLAIVQKLVGFLVPHVFALVLRLGSPTAFNLGVTSSTHNLIVAFAFTSLLKNHSKSLQAGAIDYLIKASIVQLVFSILYAAVGAFLHRYLWPFQQEDHAEVSFQGIPTESEPRLKSTEVTIGSEANGPGVQDGANGRASVGDVDLAEIRQQQKLQNEEQAQEHVVVDVETTEGENQPLKQEGGGATDAANETNEGEAAPNDDRMRGLKGMSMTGMTAEEQAAEVQLIETLRNDFGDGVDGVPRAVQYHNNDQQEEEQRHSDLPAELAFKNHIVYDDVQTENNEEYLEPDDGHIRYFNPDD